MARILLIGGGARGRALASDLRAAGHVVRITTRTEAGRAAIEQVGAECWIGTPDRLATLRGALDSVTILCWLLGSAVGSEAELRALHSERLEFLLTQAIDTTVRGFVLECRGTSVGEDVLRSGELIATRVTERNSIPLALLREDPADADRWLAEAVAAVDSLLSRG